MHRKLADSFRLEIRSVHEYGIEIGNHAQNHTNDVTQVATFKIGDTAIDGGYGFASPRSVVCKKNVVPYHALVKNGKLLYICTGRQIRRDGFVHAFLYILLEKLKSPFLFWLYQKRNLVTIRKKYSSYSSLAVDAYSTAAQIKSVISRMKDGQAAIFMFHSVLKKTDAGWGKDKYFNSVDLFEEFCRFCAEQSFVTVITNRMLWEMQARAS